ncbi:DeoR family transcriptional regulator [Aurantivibrio infirmus]
MSKRISRLDEIARLVRQEGFASIEELAGNFQVTPQTIRRDINSLCEDGILRRYHGGAGLATSNSNVDYKDRQTLYSNEKNSIAQLVADFIPNDASLFINIGTTTEEVAKHLLDHKNLRVVTNNLNVANLLSSNETFEVIIAGGSVRPWDKGITGEATIDLIKQFRVDYGIIGISAIDSDGALLDFDYHEVRVAQAIIENSRNTLLVADHSKIGRKAMVRLGHLSQVEMWFTDQEPSDELMSIAKRENVEIYFPAKVSHINSVS